MTAAWLTPAGSSPARPAGSGSRPRARRRGRWPTGSSRRSSRSSSRTCAGAAFLDLFAGCGAAGIEALSRGAAHATFVERDKGAAAVIADQPRRGPAWPASAPGSSAPTPLAWLRRPGRGRRGPFDVVVVDPPYAETGLLVGGASRRSGRASRRAPGSSPSTSGATPPPAAIGLLASERERRFGETTLTFYRRAEDR